MLHVVTTWGPTVSRQDRIEGIIHGHSKSLSLDNQTGHPEWMARLWYRLCTIAYSSRTSCLMSLWALKFLTTAASPVSSGLSGYVSWSLRIPVWHSRLAEGRTPGPSHCSRRIISGCCSAYVLPIMTTYKLDCKLKEEILWSSNKDCFELYSKLKLGWIN